ncbi:MAG: GntR family transcriptional regulator, vanillate catabolism transcriptional regulator [Burkholderiales bacterium]|jgi:GntR family transcriptional regulator of vanillate catabolism
MTSKARTNKNDARPVVEPRVDPVRASLTKATPEVRTRAQEVTDRLREAILAGEFRPNERLQEVALSEMLDVSRTPIRAALHRLAAEGMLEYAPNRGYSVRGLDTGELLAVFDIRGALEGLAARFAAERGMSQEEQRAYCEALAEGDRILGKGRLLRADMPAFREVNVRIHDTIIRASGNRMIGEMIRVSHNIPMASDRNILWDDYRWIVRSHDDHHRIYEAIMDRDAPRSEQLMREHVHMVKMSVKQRVETLQVIGDQE